MGGNRGRHPNRNPCRTIGQQIGEGGRQNNGLAPFPVIGAAKINGIVIYALQQPIGGFGQPCLSIPHGRWVIAIDQGIAHRKFLRQSHHGFINRTVAMGVIFTHDIPDDTRAFLKAAFGVQLQFAHRK